MKNKYIAPERKSTKFTCPHCEAIASHVWGKLTAMNGVIVKGTEDTFYQQKIRGARDWRTVFPYEEWLVSQCENCEGLCIWYGDKMIYPDAITVGAPNDDLPEDIKKDYLEAAAILNKSPRGAAALLRLCIQKLCKELGQEGENLNNDIAELSKKGLPPQVIQAMDVLRVTGNNAVHPGVIDLNDNPEIAIQLFDLVNFIADKMITEPKAISAFYESVVPESAKAAIVKRTKK